MKNLINKIKQSFEKHTIESKEITYEEGLEIIENLPEGKYFVSYYAIGLGTRAPEEIDKKELFGTYKSFMKEDGLFKKGHFKGDFTEEKFSYKSSGKMSCSNTLYPKRGPLKGFPDDAAILKINYEILNKK